MDPILRGGRDAMACRVIEDVAQAMGGSYRGTKLGSLGDAAAFSFFPSKNLGGLGDGGMVVTDSDDVAESARMLRAHGSKRKYANEVLGYNSRLDELQAAVLRVKLRYLDGSNEGRRRTAATYDAELAGLAGVATPVEQLGSSHVYHQYTVRIAGGLRDRGAERDSQRVGSARWSTTPCRVTPFPSTKVRVIHCH